MSRNNSIPARLTEEDRQQITDIVVDILFDEGVQVPGPYPAFVASNMEIEPGQVVIGKRWDDGRAQPRDLTVGAVLFDDLAARADLAPIAAQADQAARDARDARAAVVELSDVVIALALRVNYLLPTPVETPVAGDVLTAGTDLLPHWHGSTPPPPPPAEDTKWRDLWCPSDRYSAYSGVTNPLEFLYGGSVCIRRVANTVTVRVAAMTGKTQSGNPDLISYVVPKLPGKGWLPAAPTAGTVQSSIGPVKWDIPVNSYQTGPGLHIPNHVAVYAAVEFVWTTADAWPDVHDKAFPRESADQS